MGNLESTSIEVKRTKKLYHKPTITLNQAIPKELDKSVALRAARLDDFDNVADLPSLCTGFTSWWLAMVESEEGSPRDAGRFPALGVELIEVPTIDE